MDDGSASRWRSIAVALWLVGTAACAPRATVPEWNARAFRDLDTLEFRTVGPAEQPHWSTVWLVEVDDEVCIRLGSRAAARMRANTTNPYVAVRVGGREYERVRAEEVPEKALRVADAMAAKYWTDVFVRLLAHPLTMRLVPEPAAH